MVFPHLLSPFNIRSTTFRNRIFSTGHMTRMTVDGKPSSQMIAYHEARAKGGAGLIICEAARVHDSALSDAPAVDASHDGCISPYRQIVERVHGHGCKVFGQVSHSGRVNDRRRGGLLDVPWSASSTPDERFHNMPREMGVVMIREIIDAYASAAARMVEAGMDGVEVPASHGLLPAQFINPRVNTRKDEYGGSLENRLRFLNEILTAIRQKVGSEVIVGVRFSVDEYEHDGLVTTESSDICATLSNHPALDYLNVIAGSMAGLGGSIHVVPPMMVEHAYTAPLAATIKSITDKPVFVAGRINQPQLAEQILAAGQADMCGMTRAMIADPEMPNKTLAGEVDRIRSCIGCNQACIGHYHLGTPISCIQHPVTGREEQLSIISIAPVRKKVFIAGAGPAGLKAASTAASRGHDVTVYESASESGGQVKLARMLPGRSEFGVLTENLLKETQEAGVAFRFNTVVDKNLVKECNPDAVVIATGALPYTPKADLHSAAQVMDAWQLLRGEQQPGARVVVADWRADWVGVGVAELLARNGCHVRLLVNAMGAGEALQSYLRNQWIGTIHKLGVEVIPYARLIGADEEDVYFQHILSNEPIICEQVDTLVLAQGHQSDDTLEKTLGQLNVEVLLAGDCLSPRTAEEAIYEGMMAGIRL